MMQRTMSRRHLRGGRPVLRGSTTPAPTLLQNTVGSGSFSTQAVIVMRVCSATAGTAGNVAWAFLALLVACAPQVSIIQAQMISGLATEARLAVTA